MKKKPSDLSQVPIDQLFSELGRRRSAMRRTNAAGSGRPPILKPCPVCGKKFGVAAMRLHVREHRCD
jgi:hypothetical protein